MILTTDWNTKIVSEMQKTERLAFHVAVHLIHDHELNNYIN